MSRCRMTFDGRDGYNGGVIAVPIEPLLLRAWALVQAPNYEPTWRATVWPLIFCVETAIANGERDHRAEQQLAEVVGASPLG